MTNVCTDVKVEPLNERLESDFVKGQQILDLKIVLTDPLEISGLPIKEHFFRHNNKGFQPNRSEVY